MNGRSPIMPSGPSDDLAQTMQFGSQHAVRAGQGVAQAAAGATQSMNAMAAMQFEDRWKKKERDLMRDQMKQQMAMQSAGLISNIAFGAIGAHQGYMSLGLEATELGMAQAGQAASQTIAQETASAALSSPSAPVSLPYSGLGTVPGW